MKEYGVEWENTKAYEMVQGDSNYNHQFGGDDWETPKCPCCEKPMHIIAVLDMNDPKLDFIKSKTLETLPLASCLNCSMMWMGPQSFLIQEKNKKMVLLSHSDDFEKEENEELIFPVPLPKFSMVLNELEDSELPTDEDKYWACFDRFGSEYAIRISELPLFAERVVEHTCEKCRGRMSHIASITSESYGEDVGLFGEISFHIGELVLYFYICKECNVIKTETQSI